jgi:ABC-type nickel/cobalt efflux system permease component RcnA
MTVELLTVLGVGFLLGLRHALDPDHVIAVSTIASRTGSLLKATASGIYWGIGHTLTLFIVGMIFLGMKATIPETLALSLEMLVGLMIVILGWLTIWSFLHQKVHVHEHEHEHEVHAHFHSHKKNSGHNHKHISKPEKKSFLIGVIHGFAGSGALVLLTMGSMNSLTDAGIYIMVFGGGTILGMLIFAFLLSLPFVLLSKYSAGWDRKLGLTAGFISIVYGLFFMYQIGFVEGLFLT